MKRVFQSYIFNNYIQEALLPQTRCKSKSRQLYKQVVQQIHNKSQYWS